MAHDLFHPIIVTDGRWRHIRSVRVYHRHYPEVCGEGYSLAEAIRQLSCQLVRALDGARGTEAHEAIEQALNDLQKFRAETRKRRLRPVGLRP